MLNGCEMGFKVRKEDGAWRIKERPTLYIELHNQ